MTLAESRGIKGPTDREAQAEEVREGAHPGPLEYIKIGLILAAITAVEVGIYYIEAIEDVLVPILIVLSALKFTLVVLWFMHLRFDNRLFSWLLGGGLMLAVMLMVIVLAMLGGRLV
ncbi:MAG: cytochrome C oxidase subunit IV family protein [Chloroflexi bacterium]|nr:cytochrome C oxidase subunit IV family protein [Chloroflexota bacterium]